MLRSVELYSLFCRVKILEVKLYVLHKRIMSVIFFIIFYKENQTL